MMTFTVETFEVRPEFAVNYETLFQMTGTTPIELGRQVRRQVGHTVEIEEIRLDGEWWIIIRAKFAGKIIPAMLKYPFDLEEWEATVEDLRLECLAEEMRDEE